MLKLIGGNEPYMVDMWQREFTHVKDMQLPELNFLSTEVLDETVLSHLSTFPMMDKQRVALVKVQSLKDVDNSCLRAYLKKPTGLLVVRFAEYDGRTAFFKEMKKAGYLFLYNKEDSVKDLKPYLEKKASQKGVAFADGVLDLLLKRVDYLANEGVTMYTLLGYIGSLSALGNPITQDMVCSIVPEFNDKDTFGIWKMIAAKDIRSLRIQASLSANNAIGVLSALLYGCRVAYTANYFPLKEIGVSYNSLSGKSKESLIEAMDLLVGQVASVKSGTVSGELVLMDTFLKLINLL